MGNFFKSIFGKKDKKPPQEEPIENAKNSQVDPIKAADKSPEDISGPLPISPTPIEATLPIYNPDLDLREYKYPTINLVGEHSECLDALRDVIFKIPLLWSNDERIIVRDLEEIKNVLITGTQSTGKTVLLHQFILSLLYKKHPAQIKLILADSKGIEFNIYKLLENHFLAKLPGEENSIIETHSQLVNTLNSLCLEMDNRYELFKEANVRNVKEYNAKFIDRKLDPLKGHQYLPSIVLFIDDLGAFSIKNDSTLTVPLQKLISESYKAGIFSIISTSQFSGHSLSSVLLSLTAQRVVFKLNSREDYRKFFDTIKLEAPAQTGEFLYLENNSIVKGKAILFDFSDIESVVDFIGAQKGYPHAFLLPDAYEHSGEEFDLSDRDSLFEDAARLIVQNQIGSTSLLQRRMKLGYNRTGRLMDQLEAAGIVGPNQGSKARDVLIKTEMELQQHLDALG